MTAFEDGLHSVESVSLRLQIQFLIVSMIVNDIKSTLVTTLFILYLSDALLQDKAEVWRNVGSTKHQWLYKWIVCVHQRLGVCGESPDVSL